MKNPDSRHKVLLIEDNELDQMAFKRFVEQEDLPYDYAVAGSVAEGKELLSSRQFDVVLCDYSLGDGTALDILDIVKRTPVILITGAGAEEVAVSTWRKGAYDYLTKDLDRNYLKALPITLENAIRYAKTAQQAQLLSAAVMSTSECVCITDLEDKIIFVNNAFCKTYGYTQDEVIGKNSNILWMAKPQNNLTRSVFRTSIGTGESKIGFYHQKKDGNVFPVSISKSIVRDEKQNSMAVVAVVRDISELLQIEDRIRTLNQRLQEEARVTI
jgi:PAS domain S-box-containing protein